jgi:hypothetical protein
MSPFGDPLHVLFLDKPFAHHLVNRGLDKGSTDGATLSVPLPEVGNKVVTVANRGHAGITQFSIRWQIEPPLYQLVILSGEENRVI